MRVTIHKAKTQLSRLLVRVAGGEEVVILNRDRPVARIVPCTTGRFADLEGDLRGKVGLAGDFAETPADFKDYT